VRKAAAGTPIPKARKYPVGVHGAGGLLDGIDRPLDGGVAHGIRHHEVHPRGQALPKLVEQREVGLVEAGGVERLELHEQVDVALPRPVVGPQHRAKGMQPCHVVALAGSGDGVELGSAIASGDGRETHQGVLLRLSRYSAATRR